MNRFKDDSEDFHSSFYTLPSRDLLLIIEQFKKYKPTFQIFEVLFPTLNPCAKKWSTMICNL